MVFITPLQKSKPLGVVLEENYSQEEKAIPVTGAIEKHWTDRYIEGFITKFPTSVATPKK